MPLPTQLNNHHWLRPTDEQTAPPKQPSRQINCAVGCFIITFLAIVAAVIVAVFLHALFRIIGGVK